MAYQEFLGRFYVGTDRKDFSLTNGSGTFVIALTVGYYYMRGWTSESTAQFVEHMQIQIRAGDASLSTATVEYDPATGKISLTFATTTAITWTDTALQTMLGFTGTQSGATTYTGTSQARYTWRPTVPIAEHPLALTSVWMPRSTTRVVRSKDGTLGSVKGTQIDEAILAWRCLPELDVIPPSAGTTYRDLRQFFIDVVHEGELVRYQPNRTAWTSSDVHIGRIAVSDKNGGEVGSFDDRLNRKIASYNGLWDVELRLWKNV